MKIIINGKEQEVEEGLSVLNLIKKFNFDPEKIVVEINLEIIKKEDFDKIILKPNDKVEILRFVGGG